MLCILTVTLCVLIVMLCIPIIIFLHSYCYACSELGVLLHCVALCIVCV
jgi:hypothetical protein